jgi:hypothetical protein
VLDGVNRQLQAGGEIVDYRIAFLDSALNKVEQPRLLMRPLFPEPRPLDALVLVEFHACPERVHAPC